MGERRMRRLVAAVAAAAVTAGLTGLTGATAPAAGASPATPAAPAALAAPAQAAEPMLMIEPASALVDGSEVTYTASGLDPDAFVAVVQCRTGSTSMYEGGCDYYDAAYPMVEADGTATGTLRVDGMLSTGFVEEETVDCRAAGACVLAVVDAEGEGGLVATAPLPFVAGSPLAPAPTVTVSPAEGLDDLQSVSVTGSGFVWSDRALVLQCAAGAAGADTFVIYDDCDFDTATDVAVTDGTFEADYPASAAIATSGHGRLDCRQAGVCEVVATAGRGAMAEKTARAAVTFDPSAVVDIPTLAVDPASGLADGDTVTVTGSGFRPDSFVDASLCVGDPAAGRCRWLDAWGEVDAAGEVTVEARVFALVVVWNGNAEETVDCRTSEEPCTIVLSPGNVASVRAGSAPLLFDPDAPLLPAPEIELTPATDLADDATVTVSGRNFTPGGYATLYVCGGGDLARCDESASSYSDVDADGNFTVDMALSSTLSTWDGQTVDCRAEACAIVATDEARGRTVTAPLTFAPEAPPVHRYLDPVFDEVNVTRDVVFRDVTDAAGNPVQLTADIYEPAGDTAAKRPAIVWMAGGWFDKALDMAAYADAFARRGYVAVTMEYRSRPGFSCCPTRDALGVTAALVDVHDDATHGVMWLREHAAEHRIDPDAIAAGGAQAGAVAAYGLAFRPGESHHHGPAEVAAALPIGGMSLGEPGDEGAPVLAFHGADDLLAPTHLSDWTCADAHHMDVTCEVVEYPNTGGQLAVSRQRDIVRRSADFLATNMLEPLGYDVGPVDPAPPVEPPAEPPTKPADPPHGGTGTPGTPGPGSDPGSGGDPGAGHASGRLPKTGSDPLPLLQVGLLLAATGAALVTAAGWRRRRGLAAIPVGVRPVPGRAGRGRRGRRSDEGGTRLPAVAIVAIVGLVVGLMAAPGYTLARQAADEPTTTVPDETGTPGASTTVTVTPDGGATVTTATDALDHDHATTTTAVPPTSTTAGDATTTTVAGDHDEHGEHDPGEHDPDEPTDPGFPEDWTPEQVAYAEQLIADTEAALPRFANPAILPLLGYTWIFDGTTEGSYQHWINTSLIVEAETMNPEAPESLVFRNTADGPVLEAAMFMLPVGYNLSNIPADIAWLPDWHVHENLCFDNNFRIVGLTVDGVCERGFNYITPPMVHVWTVDTPCGRFAGVDENGLRCDHEH